MASAIFFSPGNVVNVPIRFRTRTASSFPPTSTPTPTLVARPPSVTLVRANNSGQDTSVNTTGRTLEECEAAAVAGNFPSPPPHAKPPGPKGTPLIKPLVSTN